MNLISTKAGMVWFIIHLQERLDELGMRLTAAQIKQASIQVRKSEAMMVNDIRELWKCPCCSTGWMVLPKQQLHCPMCGWLEFYKKAIKKGKETKNENTTTDDTTDTNNS